MSRKTRSAEQAETTTVAEASTTEATTTPAPATETSTNTTTVQTKPLPTLDEALAAAKAGTEHPERWARVVRVVALTAKGKPARVVVACEQPQTKQGPDGKQVSVCQYEREIAVQDLFQVRACVACADRATKLKRRKRAAAKAKADRALARQVREGTLPATEAGVE